MQSSKMQFIAVQISIVKCISIQCSEVQYGVVEYSPIEYSAGLSAVNISAVPPNLRSHLEAGQFLYRIVSGKWHFGGWAIVCMLSYLYIFKQKD